jgi:hypothetical protein
MVDNPYDVDDLDEDVKRLIRQYKPEDLLDFDAGQYAIVVDTTAEGTDLTHMNANIAQHLNIPLPEDAENWEDLEFASDVIEDAENEIAEELNRNKSLTGQYGFETNEGFGDRQLVFRFPPGTFPAWEGICINEAEKEDLVRRLEAVTETHKIPELDELLERLRKLPACED